MRKIFPLAAILVFAVFAAGLVIIYGSSNASAATHQHHHHSVATKRFHHVHATGVIEILRQATLNHQEVAIDLGVSYMSSGYLNVGRPRLYKPYGSPIRMGDGVSGLPVIYSACNRCQHGSSSACIGMYGETRNCICSCGSWGCMWVGFG